MILTLVYPSPRFKSCFTLAKRSVLFSSFMISLKFAS
nr:MAG TPA: hypothetical protein [Caudoviricetes sp.]